MTQMIWFAVGFFAGVAVVMLAAIVADMWDRYETVRRDRGER